VMDSVIRTDDDFTSSVRLPFPLHRSAGDVRKTTWPPLLLMRGNCGTCEDTAKIRDRRLVSS